MTQIARRLFVKMLLFFLVGVSAIGMAGCPPPSLATIISEIKAWAPTVVNAVQNLLNLLGSLGVIPIGTGTAAAALIGVIQGLVNSVLATITEYENDPAADKQTLLGKIREFLGAIADNVSGFVNGLNLSGNPMVKLIGTLVGFILSTIAGFLNNIPVPVGAKSITLHTSVTLGGEVIVVKPKLRDHAQFVHDWNGACVKSGHPETQIH
jgi:hypothetical protein